MAHITVYKTHQSPQKQLWKSTGREYLQQKDNSKKIRIIPDRQLEKVTAQTEALQSGNSGVWNLECQAVKKAGH